MRRPSVALWLLLVAAPAAAQEEGFGGAGGPEEPECKMPGPDGRWRPCAELLEEVAAQEGEAAAPEPPPKPRGRARVDEPLHASAGKELDRSGGAFGRMLQKSAAAAEEERFPLVELRALVASAADEVKAAQNDPARYREAPAKKAEHRLLVGVLEQVERVGYQRVRACIAEEKPEWAKAHAPPSMYRMTPGGPVFVPEEKRRRMPEADVPGCERVRLVDDALVADVTRLHELEQRLATERFGFYERDERKALLAEVERLKRAIADGVQAPLPRLFERKRKPRGAIEGSEDEPAPPDEPASGRRGGPRAPRP